MNTPTDLLTVLGGNIYIIIIACIELIAAVLLLGIIPAVKRRSAGVNRAVPGVERLLLSELSKQDDEICIILRRSDMLPAYAAGDVESVLGASLDTLRGDITCMLARLNEPSDGQKFWKVYGEWDGANSLTTVFEMKGSKWLHLTVHRCRDKDYDLFIFRDMTEERLRQAEYESRLSKAEEASQFKTSFLFRMSHEIRTPMNGITGMLTLAEGKLEPDHPAMQYLSKADELTAHLLSLINDILDMSRIEAGKVELEKAPFSLRALGSKLYDMFAKTLEQKSIRYSVDFEEMTADWVVGDELRISQIVINFLSNAVKFTSQGEVTVTFRQMLLRKGSVDLMIRVHDTGIGMKPEFINRIFRPFEQEDASTTRRYGGTGLGMAISDQLVKLMGGQIVVESLPGKGSDFSVFLSLPTTSEPKSQHVRTLPGAEGAEAPHYSILMAEDNEINAMIAVELLTQRGATVDVAENGQKALDMFSASEPGHYDVILMDIQMPVMDGRTSARHIRALSRPDAASIPIIALSADAFVEDERLSRESGMDGHLAKPINFDELWKTMESITAEKEGDKQ